VSAKTAEQVRKNCEYAQQKGVDGVVLAPFSLHYSNRGMPQKVGEIAKDFPDLCFYLYNNSKVALFGPRGAERDIEPKIYGQMLDEIENIGGITVSTGVPELYRKFKEEAEKRSSEAITMIGDETKIIHCGLGDPSVPSIGNLDPGIVSSLYEPTEFESDLVDIQAYINFAGKRVYLDYQKIPGGLKYALSLLGICGETCANPDFELTDVEKHGVGYFLSKIMQKYFPATSGIEVVHLV
jgi:dihydrodipicolinate synthase/N-acetylneuraminate lyase